MSKEAMKLALEALEHLQPTALTSFYTIGDRDKAIAALREALSKPDFWEGYVPEPDKRQQALDKKAENARELGLDYEPAQQEPLSEEWIAYCWRKSRIGTRIHYVDYLALVRETERAHGIKENT